MNSFRIKIVISLIGLSLISFAAGGFYTRTVLHELFEEVVQSRTSQFFIDEALAYYKAYGSWQLAYETESFAEYRARIGLPPERPLPSRMGAPPRFMVADLDGVIWLPASDVSYSVGDIVPERVLQQSVPIRDEGVLVGYAVPEGEVLPSEIEDRYLQALHNSWLISLLVVAVVAIPLGLFMGNRLAGPVNELIRAIGAMGPTTMRQEVSVRTKDELGLLSSSFNQMSKDLDDFVRVNKRQRETISESENLLRQGLVNISHELRTPLYSSVSRAYAMLDGVRALDKEQMTKLASSLDYLSQLVDKLYQLSLADVQAISHEFEDVDFLSLVKDCVAARQEDFANKELTLDVSLPIELVIDGDATRLRQIIENLLSNCLRYSGEGANVNVDLSVHNNFAELVVSDSGPGVPEDSLSSLFDRFYRVDASRSRATGGTGLGLSLVKTCAELHGGDVEAFHSEAGGLGIRVRIPVPSFE